MSIVPVQDRGAGLSRAAGWAGSSARNHHSGFVGCAIPWSLRRESAARQARTCESIPLASADRLEAHEEPHPVAPLFSRALF